MEPRDRDHEPQPTELVVYGSTDCCLCEEALAALRVVVPSLGLSLRYVRIDGRPELERAYREQVPVGFVAGRKVFKFRVDHERLRRAAARVASAPGQDPVRDPHVTA